MQGTDIGDDPGECDEHWGNCVYWAGMRNDFGKNKDIQKSLANGKSIAEIAEKEGLTLKEVCKLSSQKRMTTVLDSAYPDGYCRKKQTYKCLNNGCQSFKQK